MNRPKSGIYVRVQVDERKWDSILIEDLTIEQFDFQFAQFEEDRLSAFFQAYHRFVVVQLLPYVLELEAVQVRANATLNKINEHLSVLGALNKDIDDAKT